MNKSKLAYFILTAQSIERVLERQPETVSKNSLPLSRSLDLSAALPSIVKEAELAANVFRYLFVFENFLRELIEETLSEGAPQTWWEDKVPAKVKNEILSSLEREETKAWMALGTRKHIELTNFSHLFMIIDERWNFEFKGIIRDKFLIEEARHITHLRNAICHMTAIPDEEFERIKQVLRDWFRIVSP